MSSFVHYLIWISIFVHRSFAMDAAAAAAVPVQPVPSHVRASMEAKKFVCKELSTMLPLVFKQPDGQLQIICPKNRQGQILHITPGDTYYIEVLSDESIRRFQSIMDKTTLTRKLGKGRDYKEKAPEGMDQMKAVAVFAVHHPLQSMDYEAKKESIPNVDPRRSITGQPLCQPGPGYNKNPAIDSFPPPDITKGETYLYHGTDPVHLRSIIANGLSEMYGNDEGLFGKGIYFTEMASKVDQYSTSVPGTKGEEYEIHPALIVKVAMGKTAGGTGRDYVTLRGSMGAKIPIRPNTVERLITKVGTKRIISTIKMHNVQQVLKHYKMRLGEEDKQALKKLEKLEKDGADTASDSFLSLIGEGYNAGRGDGTRTTSSDGNEFVVYDGRQTLVTHIWFYQRATGHSATTADETFILRKSKPLKPLKMGSKFKLSSFHIKERMIRFEPSAFYWAKDATSEDSKDLIDFSSITAIKCEPADDQASRRVNILYESPKKVLGHTTGMTINSRYFFDGESAYFNGLKIEKTGSTDVFKFARMLAEKISLLKEKTSFAYDGDLCDGGEDDEVRFRANKQSKILEPKNV